ncbi:hypothetical protein PYCCODRAFT_378331 [Trametes coccinea BRFM310]|uniref:F-box domain-containing protein n=1 Tax=Trametes coccinea (strain BRFM310) TaxID=1353009 RepID=A0A1Y2J3N9_TRAC3|nr:hypothetical protein PYCCODRAFT_378331 [Trametes coccinea BRFM310]
MQQRITLADVPEEILERILALVLVQSAELSPRPSWHPYSSGSSSSASAYPTVISPLLVCRSWLRIATPIHYRHPVLRTARHAELFLRALRHTPALALCVRSLHLHETSPALRELVAACVYMHTLDITVNNDSQPDRAGSARAGDAQQSTRDRALVEYCEAFSRARSIRHLVIRKNAYLTQPNVTYIFEQLSKAISGWRKLETVNVAFRLSPSPAASALTRALATAPRLHTLYTQLPAVWNTTLLDIAQNPSLARIVLDPAPEHAGAHLFLAEAKRHQRLVDLIRAGAGPRSHPRHASPGRAQPPSAHDSFSLASSARARAFSTAVVAGHSPMPVATWGYERDVPPPACPPGAPLARPGRSEQHPGYAYAQAPSPMSYAAPQYPYGYPTAPQHPGAYYHQHQPVIHPGPSAAPGTLVGGRGQAEKRSAGSRRMTAS